MMRRAIALMTVALAAVSVSPRLAASADGRGMGSTVAAAPAEVIASPIAPRESPGRPAVEPLPPPQGYPTAPPPDAKPPIEPRSDVPPATAPDRGAVAASGATAQGASRPVAKVGGR
jgi:hypothetical protein